MRAITTAALDAFPGRRVALIAGGHDRGIDYAPLATGLAALSDEPAADDVAKVCLAQTAVAVVTARAKGDLYDFAVLNCADGSTLGFCGICST